MPGLTPRKAMFVAEYIRTRNATQSAIAAGYSEKTAYSQASRLLRNVEVQQALQQANATAVQVVAEKLEEAAGSAAWIIERTIEVVERSLEHQPVYVGQGRNRHVLEGVFEYDGRTVVAALGLLAKRHPEFREGPSVDASQHLHLPEGTTIDDLRKLAGG